MRRTWPALPALALSAAVIAAGAATLSSSPEDAPAPAVVADAAVAPVPVTLVAGPSARQEKQLRLRLTAAATAHAAAAAAAPPARVAPPRASRSRRTAPVVSGDPRTIARSMLAARGQSGQFGCLDSLWTKESGWRVHASNGSSGAYGIPQSLPGSKMASAGSDWRTSAATQIRWGLGYIDGRYGSPCGAWAHSRSHGWY